MASENKGTLLQAPIMVNTRPFLCVRHVIRDLAATEQHHFFHLHLAPDVIRGIVTALARGQSIRTAAEVCGVSKDTAWRVFKRASKHSKLIVDNLLRDLHLEGVPVG